jgi:hypothetical protein
VYNIEGQLLETFGSGGMEPEDILKRIEKLNEQKSE